MWLITKSKEKAKQINKINTVTNGLGCSPIVMPLYFSLQGLYSPAWFIHPTVHMLVFCKNARRAICPLAVQKSVCSPSGIGFNCFFKAALSKLYNSHSINKYRVSCLLRAEQLHLSFGALRIKCWNDFRNPFPVFN